MGVGDLREGVAPPDWARTQMMRRRGTGVRAQRARPKLYATLDAASVPEGFPVMDPESGLVEGGPEVEEAPPVSAFQGTGASAGGAALRPVSPILQSPNRRRILGNDVTADGDGRLAAGGGAGAGESKDSGSYDNDMG